MNTRERLDKQARIQEWVMEQPQHKYHPAVLVLLVVLGSFAAGLIPFAYTSAIGKTESPAPITAGEAGVWSVLGEK